MTGSAPGEAAQEAASDGAPEPAPEPATDKPSLAGPIEYLAGLAQQAQVVLLGDAIGVRQHLELLAEAVPALSAAGYDCLAWEFTNTRQQAQLDALVGPGAESFDRALCADLFVDLLGVGFGYQQYADVLEAVWLHNQQTGGTAAGDTQATGAGRSAISQPEAERDSRPLRMVALGQPSYVEEPDLLEGRSAAERVLRNWLVGAHFRDANAYWALGALNREVMRQGQRALVYAEVNHTATRSVEWHEGLAYVTLGNLLHRFMGDGVRRLLLHGALDDPTATQRVEDLVAASPEARRSGEGGGDSAGDAPSARDAEEGAGLGDSAAGAPSAGGAFLFGLDLPMSPLGNVAVNAVIGSVDGTVDRSTGRLRLRDVADGYLFVASRESWQPATLLEPMLSESNLAAAEARHRALVPRSQPYTLAELQQVRAEGQAELADSWPPLPEPPEEPTKRRRRRKG